MSVSGDVEVIPEGSRRRRVETFEIEENPTDQVTPARPRNSARMKLRKYSCMVIALVVVVACGLALDLGSALHFWLNTAGPSNGTLHPLADLTLVYGNTLNTTADACEDMYGLACYRTVKRFESYKVEAVDVASEAQQKGIKCLQAILEKPLLSNDTENLAKLKTFFKACVEKGSFQDIGRVKQWVDEVGGWPLIGKRLGKKTSLASSEEWMDVIEELNRAGVATFFPFRLSWRAHPVHRGRMAILLKPFLHDRTELLPTRNDTTRIREIMSILQTNNMHLDEDWIRCVNFESILYQNIAFKGEKFESHTIAGLTSQFSSFPWVKFFSKVFVDTKINISKNESIWIQNPQLFPPVFRLLRETPASVIRNYVMYQIFNSHKKFILSGLSKQTHSNTSLSEECTHLLVNKASILTGQVYVENFVSKMATNDAHSIFLSIRSAALDYFHGTSWLDVYVRTDVLRQLKNIRSVVGYTQGSSLYIEKLIYNLEFQQNANFQELYWNLSRFDRIFTYGQSVMSSEDHHYATLLTRAVDAEVYLFEATNHLYIPAGMLQEPYYAVSRPKYLSYPGLGVAIARVILRSLRVSNRCENSIFCPRYEFETRKACLVNLYGSYLIKQVDRQVNGLKTFDENLIDTLAWKIAYTAYITWEAKYLLPEITIPGFTFNQTQWFWIQAATAECQHMDDHFLRRHLVFNSRSPAQAKVNVGMSCLREFRTAFGCIAGSRAKKLRHCEY